ncbi:MAG: hypothetical protein ABIH00_02345 [Armatimonadota bacterium]
MDIKRLCLKEKLSKETKYKLSRYLNKKHHSLLADLKRKYLSEFGISDINDGIERDADLFLLDGKNINFYYFSKDYDYLEIGTFSLDERIGTGFEPFKDDVRNVLSSDIRNNIMFEGTEESPYFKYVKEETHPFDLNKEQLRIADELKDEDVRCVIEQIKEGIWINEFKNTDGEKLEEILKKLEEHGLIKREYVVFCTETKAQIIRVSSYDIIEESHGRGFKCFSCGRMLDEEKINQFITMTDAGALFARKNFWAGFIIAAYLHNNLKRDLKVFYKEETERNSLDLIINYQSKLILLQIKEEELDLADLYYFMSKKQFYKADLGAVFSLSEPPPAVKYFLKNKNEENIAVYTSWDEFYNNITEVLDNACVKNIKELISIFTNCTKVELLTYINQFLKESSEKGAEKVVKEEKIIHEFKPELPKEINQVKAPVYKKVISDEKGLLEEYYKAEEIAGFIFDDMINSDLSGVKNKLKKFDKIKSFGCSVIDFLSGLGLYSSSADMEQETEKIVPYISEVISVSLDIARHFDAGEVRRFYFDIKDRTLMLYPAGEMAVLLLNKNRKIKIIPDINNEIIALKGVKGTFLMDSKGSVKEVQVTEDFNLEQIKEFILELYNIAIGFFIRMNIKTIEKFMVECGNYKFIVCVDKDGFRVLVADKSFAAEALCRNS